MTASVTPCLLISDALLEELPAPVSEPANFLASCSKRGERSFSSLIVAHSTQLLSRLKFKSVNIAIMFLVIKVTFDLYEPTLAFKN